VYSQALGSVNHPGLYEFQTVFAVYAGEESTEQ
jgi:hypothetical protein